MSQNVRAASSGNANVGIPARFRSSTPAPTRAPPIQLASTGLPSTWAYCVSASAVRVGSVMSWGVRMTSSPSLPGSDAAIASACR